jgi:hypothetical protein
MITSRTRIFAATVAQCLAIISFFTTPFAVSGNAQHYVKFVAAQNGHFLTAGALTAIALVVSVSVCWGGKGWQKLVAVVLIIIAGMSLALLSHILASRIS